MVFEQGLFFFGCKCSRMGGEGGFVGVGASCIRSVAAAIQAARRIQVVASSWCACGGRPACVLRFRPQQPPTSCHPSTGTESFLSILLLYLSVINVGGPGRAPPHFTVIMQKATALILKLPCTFLVFIYCEHYSDRHELDQTLDNFYIPLPLKYRALPLLATFSYRNQRLFNRYVPHFCLPNFLFINKY